MFLNQRPPCSGEAPPCLVPSLPRTTEVPACSRGMLGKARRHVPQARLTPEWGRQALGAGSDHVGLGLAQEA